MLDQTDNQTRPETRVGFVIRGDGRLASTKRLRQLVRVFEDAIGSTALTDARRLLCRRAASLQLITEQLEDDLAHGRSVDLEMMIRTQRVLATLTKQMGLDAAATERKPRKIASEPSDPLDQYLGKLGYTRRLDLVDAERARAAGTDDDRPRVRNGRAKVSMPDEPDPDADREPAPRHGRIPPTRAWRVKRRVQIKD